MREEEEDKVEEEHDEVEEDNEIEEEEIDKSQEEDMCITAAVGDDETLMVEANDDEDDADNEIFSDARGVAKRRIRRRRSDGVSC